MKKGLGMALIVAAVALFGSMGRAGFGFSVKNVRGTYASTFHGTIDGTGVLTADGAGNIVAGTETVNDGTNGCVGSLKGSYTVNPDGTGTLTIHFTTTKTLFGACPSPSNPMLNNAAIVVVSDRKIEVSGTDLDLLESGTLTKQRPPFRDFD